MELPPTTSDDILVDDLLSTIKNGIHLGKLQEVHSAAYELMKKGDLLKPNDIITLLLRDRCVVHSSVLENLYRLLYEGKQGKFSALWHVIQSTKESRAGFNMLLGSIKHPFPELTFEQFVNDVKLADCVVIDIDNLLSSLSCTWRNRNWVAVVSLMQAAAVVIRQGSFTITAKGKLYLLHAPKKASFIHVVVSLLHRDSSNTKVKRFLSACYDLALKYSFTTENDILLLFFMVVNCRKILETDDVDEDDDDDDGAVDLDKIPHWDDAAPLTEIPEWASDIETYRGRNGAANRLKLHDYVTRYNEKFHGCRERSSPQKYVDTWFTAAKGDEYAVEAKKNFIELYRFCFPQSLDDKENFPHRIHGLTGLDLRTDISKPPHTSWFTHSFRKPENFYQLRDTVEGVLERCSHVYVAEVLHSVPQLWTATSLRQINRGPKAEPFTRNLYVKPELFSIVRMQCGFRCESKMGALGLLPVKIEHFRNTTHELLLDNQLSWDDILMLILQERSIMNVEIMQQMYKFYVQNTQQATFDAMMFLLRTFNSRLRRTSMELMLGSLDTAITLDMDVEEDKDTNNLIRSPVIHTNLLLTLLSYAWKTKDHDNFMALMHAASFVLYSKNMLTHKGQTYLIKPSRRTRAESFVLVVISVLYYTPGNNSMVKSFLDAAYDFALIQPHTRLSDHFLLFFLVSNFRRDFKQIPDDGPSYGEEVIDDNWKRVFEGETCTNLKTAMQLERGNAPNDDVLQYYKHLPDYEEKKHSSVDFDVESYSHMRFRSGSCRTQFWREAYFTLNRLFKGSLPELYFTASATYAKKWRKDNKKLFTAHSFKTVTSMKFD